MRRSHSHQQTLQTLQRCFLRWIFLVKNKSTLCFMQRQVTSRRHQAAERPHCSVQSCL
ncbi:protein of unknown function [Caballeronia sp. S22]